MLAARQRLARTRGQHPRFQGIESSWGGGGGGGGGSAGLAGFLPIYMANMLKSLNARSKQADSDLALMGYPNAFPSVPKASTSDWTIMQSLRVETLRHTRGLYLEIRKVQDLKKMAVDQFTRDAEGMRVLVCNLKAQERRVDSRKSDLTCPRHVTAHVYPENLCVPYWRLKTRSPLPGHLPCVQLTELSSFAYL